MTSPRKKDMTSPSAEISASIDVQTELEQGDFPEGIERHWRIKSNWGSNELKVDVRHFQDAAPKVRVIDLNSFTLAGSDPGSAIGIYDSPIPISHFPNFIDALKVAVNSTVTDTNKGDVSSALGQTLTSCRNIFSWLIRHGIYKLADCQPEDVETLLSEVANGGWSKVNQLNRRLINLGLRLRASPEQAERFVNIRYRGEQRIKVSELEHEIGLPINGRYLPRWFRRRLFKVVRGDETTPDRNPKDLNPLTFGSATATGHALNRMSLAPAGIDSIAFYPLHSVNAAVKEMTTRSKGQTPNITISEATLLLSECLRWTYDYSPHLIAVLEEVRRSIEAGADHFETAARVYNSEVASRISSNSPITADEEGMKILVEKIAVCMTAAGCTIGIFHGRRVNEIFGHRKPYGAYFGCVEQVSFTPRAYQAEFYVEKGPQEFRSFPANVLIADAIALLERFFVLFRDISQPEPTYTSPRSASREKKLFQVRKIVRYGFGHTSWPRWRLPFNELLKRSGVDEKVWWDQHAPFRRLYATFFIHRYDMPELPALQHQLGQWGVAQAISYAYDKVQRPTGRSVREIHSKPDPDTRSVMGEIRAASSTYLKELVVDLLSGKSTGGIFPRLLLKLAKRLSASTDFRALSMERKAERLAAAAEKRGYAANPLRHTVCLAGSARHTRTRAKCANLGELRREDASPAKCSGCVHSWSNANYRRNQLRLAEGFENDAQDHDLPQGLRTGLSSQADALRELVHAEEVFSARTAAALDELTQLWENDLGGQPKS